MLGGNPASSPATSLLYAGEMFDTASQMYYNRARWYDTLTGRFNRIDPFAGNNQDPQSLHKYLYAHCNPIMSIDPSGLYNLLFARIGQIVHRELATMYRNEHPGHYVEANYYAIPGTIPALKPDIIDYTFKQIAEIKPLNARKIAEGITKLVGYLGAANTLGIHGGGWRTSKWNVGVRVVPIPEYPNWSAVTAGNWKGLILYERYKIPKEELETMLAAGLAAALLYKLKTLIEGLGDPASEGAEALDGLVYAIRQQLEGAVNLGTAQNMARTVGPAVAVGLAAHIGMRLTLAPMTARYVL
jgi:RHS repeat-associated protein